MPHTVALGIQSMSMKWNKLIAVFVALFGICFISSIGILSLDAGLRNTGIYKYTNIGMITLGFFALGLSFSLWKGFVWSRLFLIFLSFITALLLTFLAILDFRESTISFTSGLGNIFFYIPFLSTPIFLALCLMHPDIKRDFGEKHA